jgi:SRSO17 transposase
MRRATEQSVRPGVVLADAGYGDETAFRDGITAMGMLYAVGIRPATTVWAPGMAPLAPKAWAGCGAKPTKLRRESGHEPVKYFLSTAPGTRPWSRWCSWPRCAGALSATART